MVSPHRQALPRSGQGKKKRHLTSFCLFYLAEDNIAACVCDVGPRFSSSANSKRVLCRASKTRLDEWTGRRGFSKFGHKFERLDLTSEAHRFFARIGVAWG